MRHSRNSHVYESLRTWLRNNRKELGLTIRTLADKLGVPHAIVGKIEDGTRKVDVVEFVEICFALNLDPRTEIEIIVKALESSPLRRAQQQKNK